MTHRVVAITGETAPGPSWSAGTRTRLPTPNRLRPGAPGRVWFDLPWIGGFRDRSRTGRYWARGGRPARGLRAVAPRRRYPGWRRRHDSCLARSCWFPGPCASASGWGCPIRPARGRAGHRLGRRGRVRCRYPPATARRGALVPGERTTGMLGVRNGLDGPRRAPPAGARPARRRQRLRRGRAQGRRDVRCRGRASSAPTCGWGSRPPPDPDASSPAGGAVLGPRGRPRHDAAHRPRRDRPGPNRGDAAGDGGAGGRIGLLSLHGPGRALGADDGLGIAGVEVGASGIDGVSAHRPDGDGRRAHVGRHGNRDANVADHRGSGRRARRRAGRGCEGASGDSSPLKRRALRQVQHLGQ